MASWDSCSVKDIELLRVWASTSVENICLQTHLAVNRKGLVWVEASSIHFHVYKEFLDPSEGF